MNFDKTDEELEKMTEEELFEYLDAKAAYLSQHTAPLSGYHTKKFASISSAISNTQFEYDKVKKIAKENEQLGMEKFFSDKQKQEQNDEQTTRLD
jgi:hypothetical protein